MTKLTKPTGMTELSALAGAVDAATASESGAQPLERGSLNFLRTVSISVGIQGPTAGVIVGPAIIASVVGGPGSLAQVGGFVAMAFVAYAFVRFTRSFNTAGSVLAFNGTALGPAYGFASVWLLLIVYLSFAAGVYATTGSIAQTFFASIGLHSGGWVVYTVIGAVIAIGLASLRIGVSSIVTLLLEAVSVVLILVVGVTVLAKGGYHHQGLSAASFRPSGVGASVLSLGVVATFAQFSGFEGAATLGEESRRSTRTIPAAVVCSLVVSAAIYIFFTWVVYNAYPDAKTLAADPAPLVHVADSYLSPTLGKVVNVAGIISALGAQLALLNASSRLLYAIGREVGPNVLTRTSSRGRAPIGSLVVAAVVSLAGILAFSFEAQATRALTLVLQFGSYVLFLAYLLTVIAALVWTARTKPRPFPLAVLTVGVAVIGYVIYKQVHPLPEAPFNAILVTAGGTALVGALIACAVRSRLAGSALFQVIRPSAPSRGTR